MLAKKLQNICALLLLTLSGSSGLWTKGIEEEESVEEFDGITFLIHFQNFCGLLAFSLSNFRLYWALALRIIFVHLFFWRLYKFQVCCDRDFSAFRLI